MTPHDLIAAFDVLADAPDGVKRLRELVLSLAVRGKLVPQDHRDEPVWVDRTRAARLVVEARWTPEWLVEVPSGWQRAELVCLGDWGSGGTPKKGHPEYYDGNIPWLKIGDLNDDTVLSAETRITEEGLRNSSAKMVPVGAVLVAMYGSIGKAGVTGIPCCTNQAIAHCVPDKRTVTVDFLFTLVLAMRDVLLSQGKGGAQQNISQTVLKHLEVAVPPLAEQHRIVARVDELMGLLARLEAARATRDAVRRAARDAALADLRDAPDAESVEAAWSRISRQMDDLFAEPEDVVPLRQAVLHLAVRGKLVPQDSNDHPAQALVERARVELAERAQGVRRGSWKPTTEVAVDEQPFELPAGWAWARVNDTGFYINGLAFKPSDWKESGRPIIRIQNLSDPSKPFNYAVGEFPDDVVVRMGDLLVSWSATLEAFIWDREDGVLNQHIFRVKPADTLVRKEFLYYLLRQAIRDMAASEHAHGLVMAHINRGPFLNHVVAIPPHAEQQRIVAKVDALMALCDDLEARLTAATELHGQFAAAAVHHLDA